MNMTSQEERDFARFISHQLNSSTRAMSEPVAHRLHAARQAALASQSARLSLAGFGRETLSWCEDHARPFLMAVALTVAVVSGNYLVSVQQRDDIEDVDAALLTDSLPIDAYLDSGFRSWLADSTSKQ